MSNHSLEPDTGAKLIFAIGLFILFMLTFPFDAKSHSWYDPDCCNHNDCVPAKAKFLGNGRVELTSKFGKSIISLKSAAETVFPSIRPSQDMNWHICVVNDEEEGSGIRCVYVPGLS